MKIVPRDLVLVRVKAFGPDHKIADHWEQVPYRVLSQHNILQFTKSNQLTKILKKTFVHCTETCCSHYNQSGRMKLSAKMKH